MDEYKNQDNALVETVQPPPVVRTYSRESLESALAASREAVDVKVLELGGARQEVERLSALLAKCDDLGIVPDSQALTQ